MSESGTVCQLYADLQGALLLHACSYEPRLPLDLPKSWMFEFITSTEAIAAGTTTQALSVLDES